MADQNQTEAVARRWAGRLGDGDCVDFSRNYSFRQIGDAAPLPGFAEYLADHRNCARAVSWAREDFTTRFPFSQRHRKGPEHRRNHGKYSDALCAFMHDAWTVPTAAMIELDSVLEAQEQKENQTND